MSAAIIYRYVTVGLEVGTREFCGSCPHFSVPGDSSAILSLFVALPTNFGQGKLVLNVNLIPSRLFLQAPTVGHRLLARFISVLVEPRQFSCLIWVLHFKE